MPVKPIMPNAFIPKIIFFDIDDTLSRNSVLAPHNKATLEALSCTDIKLVIATGRPKPMIPSDIMALLDAKVLDAIICTNGQYSFTTDTRGTHTLISDYPLTQAQAQTIADICDFSELIYKFDSDKHLAWSTSNELIQNFIANNPSAIVDPDYHKTNTVYQCSVFFSHDTDKMEHVNFAEYGLKLVIWHHMGGDILPIEASKARAITDVCRHFGVHPNEAMAFGDGYNDIEMFQLVGCAVAMGDAQPALIKYADVVTGTIEEQGIQTVVDKFCI